MRMKYERLKFGHISRVERTLDPWLWVKSQSSVGLNSGSAISGLHGLFPDVYLLGLLGG